MPKIAASTVREHREQMFAKLVDAAEYVAKNDGALAITAKTVADRAGLARNSIYRYIDSVDELRVLVLRRNLPRWHAFIGESLAQAHTPEERLVAVVRVSVHFATDTGHKWLAELMRAVRHAAGEGDIPGVREAGELASSLHGEIGHFVRAQWDVINPADARGLSVLTWSLLDSMFAAVDNGANPEATELYTVAALRAMIDEAKKRAG